MTTIDQTHSGIGFAPARARRAPVARALRQGDRHAQRRVGHRGPCRAGAHHVAARAQHALGWFGGYGFSGTLGWMTGTLGFPAPLAALAIVTELVAPFLLMRGWAGARRRSASSASWRARSSPTRRPGSS